MDKATWACEFSWLSWSREEQDPKSRLKATIARIEGIRMFLRGVTMALARYHRI
jgi:hypothetical protein